MLDGIWAPKNWSNNLVGMTNFILSMGVFIVFGCAVAGVTLVVNKIYFPPTFKNIQALTKQQGRPEDGDKIAEMCKVCPDENKTTWACFGIKELMKVPSTLPQASSLVASNQ
jgi:membrane protein insertase Oxa1/YidC/SpoIIIJ